MQMCTTKFEQNLMFSFWIWLHLNIFMFILDEILAIRCNCFGVFIFGVMPRNHMKLFRYWCTCVCVCGSFPQKIWCELNHTWHLEIPNDTYTHDRTHAHTDKHMSSSKIHLPAVTYVAVSKQERKNCHQQGNRKKWTKKLHKLWKKSKQIW